jgi:hypothetical protein
LFERVALFPDFKKSKKCGSHTGPAHKLKEEKIYLRDFILNGILVVIMVKILSQTGVNIIE